MPGSIAEAGSARLGASWVSPRGPEPGAHPAGFGARLRAVERRLGAHLRYLRRYDPDEHAALVEMLRRNVGDSVLLAPLLASSVERRFKVRELSADKAYLSNDNLTAIEAANAVPYIPFKSNSRGIGKSDAWRHLWHTFKARNDEFLAHYHKRSNLESTSSAMKRKFGASVRTKAFTSQANEVLLKCLCQNLSALVYATTSWGSEPSFWSRMEAA